MTTRRADSLRDGPPMGLGLGELGAPPRRSVAGRIGGGLGVAARRATSVLGLPYRALSRAAGLVLPSRRGAGKARGIGLGVGGVASDESLQRLAQALADPDPHKRELALGVICEFSNERASRLLSGMLHDPEPRVRCAAAAGAMRVEATGAAFALILALDDPEAEVREAAERALEAITGQPLELDDKGPGREAKIEELKGWWKERRFEELVREE